MIARVFAALTAAFLASPVAAIDIQEVTSPGGIQAWLVQDRSIPFVALDIRFVGGTSLDPEGSEGAVHFMMGLLEEGTGELTAADFAAEVEGLAAGFGFSPYRDSVSVSARMLTQNRDEAAELLRSAIQAPSFPEDAIERVRSQILAAIESDATRPGSIASSTFAEMAFGDHPYGRASEGTRESVMALTREDLVEAHRAALTLGEVYVGAAGDISAEELGLLIDRLLGGLPDGNPARPSAPDYGIEGGITVIDFPSPQSVAFFGHAGIGRDDPDFFPAFVLNQILGGGGFRSILMEEVRENRGLTYGIGTGLSLAELQPQILGQFSSSNELVAEAIGVIEAEWARVAEEGVTQDELDAAIQYMTGAYPLRFEGNGRIAGILASMQADGMPTDYIVHRNDYVRAVTIEDVQRAAARLLQPDNLHFVVVGQPVGLSPGN